MAKSDVAEGAGSQRARPEGGASVIGDPPPVRLVREDAEPRRPAANAEQESAPLDLEAARIIARVRWLMLSVILFTIVSVAGVITVIGYRIYSSAAIPEGTIEATVALPKGAKILQTAVADGRIFVTLDIMGAVEVRAFDVKTFKPVGRLNFSGGQ